jgi:hypothetical protein
LPSAFSATAAAMSCECHVRRSAARRWLSVAPGGLIASSGIVEPVAAREDLRAVAGARASM